MRALAVLAAASTLALGGCHSTRACKQGTVLMSVDWPDTTDAIVFVVSIDGAATHSQAVQVPAGTAHGTVELDFSMYPAGHSVSIEVSAVAADNKIATSTSAPKVLANGCDTVTVSLSVNAGGDGGVAGDGGDAGAIGCSAPADCPVGQACDLSTNTCTTACSATQTCNGGCCNGTSCVTGDSSDACALGQPLCGSCVGKSSGSACVSMGGSNSCGCNSVTDCPPNQACNMTTHTCGPACDMTTPCNGGCCSALTNGTCQTGNLDAVCGNNGGLCSACSGNSFGHKCIAMTGGGQCGCNTYPGDCPASATACTANVCVNTCTPTMPCQSGCCSSSTMGTCQQGTAQGACGAAGSVCQSCAGNGNGSACLPSGACGCTKASDCPAGHACDTTQGKCTTACGSNQQCNGGCCSAASGGTCQTGTINAACGSSGVCAACPAALDCVSYACDGTSCVPQYKPNGYTPCSDGNNCTYGDHCNGSGSCVGTAYGCGGNTDCTSHSCNGDGTCSTDFQPAGTLCGLGDSCCTGGPATCNGAGTCNNNGCCITTKCCTL